MSETRSAYNNHLKRLFVGSVALVVALYLAGVTGAHGEARKGLNEIK